LKKEYLTPKIKSYGNLKTITKGSDGEISEGGDYRSH
jgi:hypothetical protein